MPYSVACRHDSATPHSPDVIGWMTGNPTPLYEEQLSGVDDNTSRRKKSQQRSQKFLNKVFQRLMDRVENKTAEALPRRFC